MHDLESYMHHVAALLNGINYTAEPDGLYAPIRYTLDCGGKRLRPVLVLAANEACCGVPEEAEPAALAIEVFHNFTLLHDDVMDKAEVRRGRPTVHKRWNEVTAILSGDAMLTMANEFLTDLDPQILPKALRLFNRTAMEVYEGQQYDIDFETRDDVSVEEYLKMIRLKTSVLLGCACALGALTARADDRVCSAFYHYGVKLGLAFQLRDDLLDTFGEEATFGKATGGDILNRKKTWLLINATNEAAHAVRQAYGDFSQQAPELIKAVKTVYNNLNLAERCQALIDSYAHEAIEALKNADLPHEAFDFFASLAVKLSSRDK